MSEQLLRSGLVLICGTLFAAYEPAAAACINLKSAADLEKMRSNLAGSFCLAKDLNLASVANFVPIGTDSVSPFTGQFDGKGHAIANLTMSSNAAYAGLFGYLAGARISNLRITAASVTATGAGAYAGILAGQVGTGTIVTGVATSGLVAGTGLGADLGGVTGANDGTLTDVRSQAAVHGAESSSSGGIAGKNNGVVLRGLASGAVLGDTNGSLGGAVGWNVGSTARIDDSRASGAVTVTGSYGQIGGLVGWNQATVRYSQATGPVTGHTYASAGGLAGVNAGTILQSQAIGPVATGDYGDAGGFVGDTGGTITAGEAFGAVATGNYGNAGGFAGSLKASSTTSQVLSIGPVSGGATFPSLGGLVGSTFLATLKTGFWDRQVSGITTSAGGKGLPTTTLRQNLHPGLAPALWSITPGASYPYLLSAHIGFRAALSAIVFRAQAFTFLPIEQLDPAQYATAVLHADAASQAAAFTSLARAIGIARNVPALAAARISDYWKDSVQTAVWKGEIASHAKLGAAISIPAGAALSTVNVITPLLSNQLVIVHGQYDNGGGAKSHWMLATGFTGSGASVTGVIALDPWTGGQVTINPVTKKVVAPTAFPLTNYTVDSYRIVSLKPV